MIDAVLSHHVNGQTCGVAKWNRALASKLGVPLWPLDSQDADFTRHPLISVKPAERATWPQHWRTFDLFLHGVPVCEGLHRAARVFAANADIADQIRPVRPDVITACCPSTLSGDPTRGAYRVLVFGMAHKLLLPHFEALKVELDAEHDDYTVELSTAVHEGSPWDQALTESVDAMRGVFGDKLRVLGFLGDDALARTLQEVDAVACFYRPALRANNTTYWAAVEAGKRIYTNRDEYSPAENAPAPTWDAIVELIRA